MSQFPGDKAGQRHVSSGNFKLIRDRATSDGRHQRTAFIVHH
jgi:hypothetical protein